VDGQPIRPSPPPSGKGGRNGSGYAAAVSPDGRLIAYGSYWHYLAIHEVLTGKAVHVIDKLLPDGAGSLAFSPDGRTLAWSGWQQPTIHLLELATGKERHRFEGHKRRVTSLAFSADGRTLISGSEDTTAMVWDLSGKQSRENCALDLDAAWHELAGMDAARAYQAMRRLAAMPTETVAYLRKQLQLVPAVDEKRLAKLIADLDSNQFAVREEASKALESLGELAVGACRKALQGHPAAEVRRRLEALLEKEAKSASEPSPERLRTLRAIEVLEHIGTPESQQVLKTLAQGAPESRLTEEAKTSLEHLAKRAQPAVKAPTGSDERSTAELPWGDAVEGVQARLHPKKVRWQAKETPAFELELRNQGKRPWKGVATQHYCELQVDGKWYKYGANFPGAPLTDLKPGMHADHWLDVSLGGQWYKVADEKEKRAEEDKPGGKGGPIVLAPGKHTIRLAYCLFNTGLGDGVPEIRLVTNLVEIEITMLQSGR
jgi:hypothetical protein